MADAKITELTENTTPATGDLLPIVDIGTTTTQKIALSSLKASGAEVTTGTEDVKFATPKAIADADVNTRLKSWVAYSTYDLSTASGDQEINISCPFTATAVHINAFLNGVQYPYSIGFADSSKQEYCMQVIEDGKKYHSVNILVNIQISAGNYTYASLKTFDPAGLTLTWTKVGSPTGTLYMAIMLLK